MKINHKVNGINTHVANMIGQLLPPKAQGNKPYIVFGVDIAHPTGLDQTEPSVGAIVASMDG